jgi:lipopolysaccharide export system permease protein
MYLARFCFLLIGIALFILSLDLVTSAEKITERSDEGIIAVAKFAALRMPQIISDTIKYASLFAALLTLVSLMRHNQLAPIWGGGISQFGVIRRLTPVVLIIGIMQFLIDDAVVPVANEALQEWGVVEQDAWQQKNTKAPTSATWVKVDNDIVRIPHGKLRENSIDNFKIFQRSAEGRLGSQLEVSAAKPDRSGWTLEGVIRRDISGGINTIDQVNGWGVGFRPKNIDELSIHPRNLAFHRLLKFVRADAHGTWAPHLYETWIQVKVAVCFIPLLMIFLVVALSQRFQRTGRTEYLFLVGLASGFAFFISNGIGLAMGEVGLLPPMIAGWAATVGFAAVTGGIAFSRETLKTTNR